MAKKTSNAQAIPRFTVSKVTKSKVCLGKLSIPTVTIEKLGDAIEEALENAAAGGVKPTSCRGVISLY